MGEILDKYKRWFLKEPNTPPGQEPPGQEPNRQLNPAGMGLLATGLSMMATPPRNVPYSGAEIIGRAGLAGLGTYESVRQQQEQERLRQERNNLLQQEMGLRERGIGIQERGVSVEEQGLQIKQDIERKKQERIDKLNKMVEETGLSKKIDELTGIPGISSLYVQDIVSGKGKIGDLLKLKESSQAPPRVKLLLGLGEDEDLSIADAKEVISAAGKETFEEKMKLAAKKETKPGVQKEIFDIKTGKSLGSIPNNQALPEGATFVKPSSPRGSAAVQNALLDVNKGRNVINELESKWNELVHFGGSEPGESSLVKGVKGVLGRTAGRAQQVAAWSGAAAPVKAYQDFASGVVAPLVRSLGEKGNLSDTDIQRAIKLIPMYPDTADEARYKLSMLKELIDKVESSIKQKIQSGEVGAIDYSQMTDDELMDQLSR